LIIGAVISITLYFNNTRLRAIAVEYIINNINEFSGFITDESNDDFIDRLSVDKTWGSHPALKALCFALNINIVVLNSDHTRPIIFKKTDAIQTIYLGYKEMKIVSLKLI
jgi:hypothetical protein